MSEPIRTISEYLQAIEQTVEGAKTEHSAVMFRGEAIVYDTPCQPNIFRTRLSKKDKFFEKNLFEEMTANHLTNGQTYLEKAIDAQHGGFPSRLLDVTYNCLAALYFAVTPYYTQKEDSLDDQDGMVYVFFLEDMYCPTGNNINDAYNACVEHNVKWFEGQGLFQKNHKLIDHIKKNPRIIAQQGAFILFQGDCLSSFPSYRYVKLRIDGHSKKDLRKVLRLYFGIHTGSIYPEEFNLVDEMIRKSEQVSTLTFSVEDELTMIFQNITRIADHYVEVLDMAKPQEYRDIVQEVEEELLDYRLRLEAFFESQKELDKDHEKDRIDTDTYREKFNRIIITFAAEAEGAMAQNPDDAMKISRSELTIK